MSGDIQEALLKAIETVVDLKLKQAHVDFTKKGKVLEIRPANSCVVEINGMQTTAHTGGLPVKEGSIVLVTYPSGDAKSKFVACIIN